MTTQNPPPPPLPGFIIDDAPTPPPERTSPNLAQLCRENDELIADLARYAENLVSEAAVRKKYRFDEATWTTIGQDDLLVEMIEAEKVRRIRNGSTKKEKAQLHIIRGPDVLAKIMDDPRANAKHKVDAIKSLDALADPGPEAAVEQERVHIVINLTGDSKLKDPKDILVIDAAARPNTQKQIEEQSDEWRR